MNEELKKCSNCGSTNIRLGKEIPDGQRSMISKHTPIGSDLIGEICSDCGRLISINVIPPKEFKPESFDINQIVSDFMKKHK